MSDPVWIPEVLRAEGLTVREWPGWRDRGHGDFGNIWGVVAHHTGNNPPSNNPGYIANHPILGLASQLHLSREGVYTVLGAGVAWHAGEGGYPGIPTNNANQVTIGIEAENNGTEGWSPDQYWSYYAGVAAILRHLGQPAGHVIGHKEWAGAAQGKWDPGSMDMNGFRADVARQITHGGDTGMTRDEMKALVYECLEVYVGPIGSDVKDIREQLCGAGSRDSGEYAGWPQLGKNTSGSDRTAVDALGAILDQLPGAQA
jgi:hypothetical protein